MANNILNYSKMKILPEPYRISLEEGNFIVNKDTIILADSESKKNAQYLASLIYPAMGFNLEIKDSTQNKVKNNFILLTVDTNIRNFNPDGYVLKSSKNDINITGILPTGVFYGIQSLRQLLPPEIESRKTQNVEWSIPCLKIEDYPRFSWRGYMLDESRHFFGKKNVKKILDLMAYLKLNIFHWHLTDDQGWRIEIKKYPLLTEIGSKRKGTMTQKRKKIDSTSITGFYTQDDLKEIISYAKELYITIIPEIDIPGHTTAVLASYPELSCTGGPFEVSPYFGVHDDILCVGKDKVFDFCEDILEEVIEIFPSKIIHIGGDEVPKKRWRACPDCQFRMKTEKIKNEEGLQTYFTNRIANKLNSHGRRLMGWNEILNEHLNNDAICQYWTNNFDMVVEHLRKGRYVVMSEMSATYLNYPYKLLPLSTVYQYEPIPQELEQKYHNYVLGIEAPLWAEYVTDMKRLEWQTFPRLIAIAETAWSPKEKKNLKYFESKLKDFIKRLDIHEINHAPYREIQTI